MLSGGWKYTFPVMPSRTACRSSRLWSVVDTSQSQKQTGALHLDVSDDPQSPLPLHIAHGKYVLVGVCVRHNADRITNGEIVIYTVSLAQHTGVANYVTVVRDFSDYVFPDTWRCFDSCAVPYLSVETICHGLGSGRRHVEGPLVDENAGVLEEVARGRLGRDVERLPRGEGGLSAGGERRARVGVLVDDVGLGRDGDDTGRLVEGRLGDRADQDVA